MAKTYNKMQIDMNGDILSSVTAVAQDTLSRYLDCNLYNNGLPIDLTGHMAQLYVKKPDGLQVFTQGEITDAATGRVQFELTNQALAETGWIELQIVLTSGGGEVLSSEIFKLHVLPSIRNDNVIESTNEFGALVVLFQEIQSSLDLMRAIIDGFGEPGKVAQEYGVTTFWGMLEASLKNVDFAGAIKSYINSTMGGDYFLSIDRMISDVSGTDKFVPLNILLGNLLGGKMTFVTSGTWKVPDGITKVTITACGGGGGGGGGLVDGDSSGGGGGGGGACIQKVSYNVTPGSEITIIIGAGGNGGNGGASPTKGSDGGATVISGVVTLAGGKGGAVGVYGGAAGGEAGGTGGGNGGSGAYPQGSDGGSGLIGSGGNGGAMSKNPSGGGGGGGGSYGSGGDGGNSFGDASDRSSVNGHNGGYGAGGGGGARHGSTTKGAGAGGKGGNGIVIIEWGL